LAILKLYHFLFYALSSSQAKRIVQEFARWHGSMPEKRKSLRNFNGGDKSAVHHDFSNDDYVNVPIYTSE
jgi:hypothetical protein